LFPTQSPMRNGVSPHLADVRLPNRLASTHQSRSALKLLQGQQTERVAHENCDAVVAAATGNHALEPAQCHDVGSQTEVGFCLAAAGCKPQEIGYCIGLMAPVRVMQIGQTREDSTE
jgi:hypothetical protein